MDDRFQMKNSMTDEEFRLFTQERLGREQSVNDFLERRESVLQMDASELHTQYGKKQIRPSEPVSDMPEQNADEKESKRLKREKADFLKQAQAVQRQRSGGKAQQQEQDEEYRQWGIYNRHTRKMFGQVLEAQLFEPKNVMSNLAAAMKTLDEWGRHIGRFLQEGKEENGQPQWKEEKQDLPEDVQIRLELMEAQYRKGVQALKTALAALGYEYRDSGKGFEVVGIKLSEEEKQRALEENRALRRELAKEGAELDETVAERVLEEAAQKSSEVYRENREGMHGVEEYGFIETKRLSGQEQYEKLKALKELLEKKAATPEYRENEAVLGKLYQEYFRLAEAVGEQYQFLMEAEERVAKKGKEELWAEGVRNAADRILMERWEKLSAFSNQADAMEAGIRYLLKQGDGLTEQQSLLLKDYIPLEGESYQRQREETRQRAKTYVLRAGQVQRGAAADAAPEASGQTKAACLEYVNRVKELDTTLLQDGRTEELLERAEELQELALTGTLLAGQLKKADISDLWTDGRDKALFEMKRRAIKAYADKARAAILMQAYRQGSLDEECFDREEIDSLYRELGQQTTEPLSQEQLLILAKRLLEQAAADRESASAAYYASEEVRETYREGEKQGDGEAEAATAYREESKRAPAAYRERIRAHYEELEEKLHHRLPSPEWIEENRGGLEELLAHATLDAELLDGMLGEMNLSLPQDVRLYRLVHTYAAMAAYIRQFRKELAAGVDYWTATAKAAEVMREKAGDSVRCLDGVQSEELSIPAETEQFKQLAADAEGILQKSTQEKLAFVRRAAALAEYIRQRGELSSPSLKQFKCWLLIVREKVPPIAEELFYSKEQPEWGAGLNAAELLERLNEQQLTEEMLTPEYVEAHMQELLMLFGLMDQYREQMRGYYAGQKGYSDTIRENKELLKAYHKRQNETMDAPDEALEQRLKQNMETAEAGRAALAAKIPAEAKNRWERREDAFKAYRSYVTKYVHELGADVAKGEYLTDENHEEQQEQLQMQQDRKRALELLGGFGTDAELLQTLAAEVGKFSGDAAQSLLAAGQQLKSLKQQLIDPALNLTDRDVRTRAIRTAEELCAGMEKQLSDAQAALSAMKKQDGTQELLDKIQTLRERTAERRENLRKGAAYADWAEKLREGLQEEYDDIAIMPHTMREYLAGVRVIATDLSKLRLPEIDAMEEYSKGEQSAEEKQKKKNASPFDTKPKYQNINNSLRGLEELNPENEYILTFLREAFSHARLPEDMTLYRGTTRVGLGKELMSIKDPQELIGKAFREPAFMSTSASKRSASVFYDEQAMKPGGAESAIILEIEAEAGARALDISATSKFKGEQEILFDAGQTMLITGYREEVGEIMGKAVTRPILTVKILLED